MESPSVSRRPSVDGAPTHFHLQQGQAPRGQAMTDGTPPALSSTTDTGNQAHAPSLDRQNPAALSTQEVAAPVTHAGNRPVEHHHTAMDTAAAICVPLDVAGGIACCAGSGPLGIFLGSIGVTTSACTTLSAAARDAALIWRDGPEDQSRRCESNHSPTTVCGYGLMAAGIGLTGLGLVGAGVPTAAVPLTLIPTWVGMATACYGHEVPANQCLR